MNGSKSFSSIPARVAGWEPQTRQSRRGGNGGSDTAINLLKPSISINIRTLPHLPAGFGNVIIDFFLQAAGDIGQCV